MKQLSSLEIHYLSKEISDLKDSRIDKIYQPEKNLIYFSLYKSGQGKKILSINVGKSLFISESKDYGETLGFGMLLRKYLDGNFLTSIEQVNSERIVKFTFNLKDDKKHLYVEFFGKGNAILCSSDDIIINALEHHEFKDRTIKPKIKYENPSKKFDMFKLTQKELNEMLSSSKKDSIVTCLATELGLGGIYSEEACLNSKISKNSAPKDIDEKFAAILLASVKKLISKKISAKAVFENGNVIDAVPFDMEIYALKEKKDFESFSSSLEFYYSQFKEVKETKQEKELKSMQKMIEMQQAKISEFEAEGKESLFIKNILLSRM